MKDKKYFYTITSEINSVKFFKGVTDDYQAHVEQHYPNAKYVNTFGDRIYFSYKGSMGDDVKLCFKRHISEIQVVVAIKGDAEYLL